MTLRLKRMTKAQKSYMINYFDKNRDLLLYNSLTNPEIDKDSKWRELARSLNSKSLGPSKTTAQWKEAFSDLKTKVRKKSKMLQTNRKDCDLKVSNAEIRLMNMLGIYAPKRSKWLTETSKDNEVNYVTQENNSTKINKTSREEFIQRQRNKMEERLHFNSNASLAVEIENHAIQMEKLASSIENQATALNSLAKSFDRIANVIETVSEKLCVFLK